MSRKLLLLFGVGLSSAMVVRAGWVDPDTPKEAQNTQALSPGDDRSYHLVFSDEFNQDGRTFHDGNDPRWTAINKNDYTNAALHYYSHDNVVTSNGVMNITTELKENSYKAFDEKKKVFYADKKYVQTGMVQGWNKFCFTGGIIEFRAKLPGRPEIGGLWPALWMLGNLARATYVGSTEFIWPFSYNQCNPRKRNSQEINACNQRNHYGLHPAEGRGSPEIDILEAMQGDPGKLPSTTVQRPYQSASLQIAPGIEIDRPVLGHRPHKAHWYPDLEYGNETKADLNPFFYGVTLMHNPKSYTYQADALSANMQLNDTHYQDQHLYRLEWEPPAADGSGGYIRWFTDNRFVYGIHGSSLKIMQTEIPSEPMYLIMNTAISSHWGFPAPCPEGCDCECFECGKPECACALPSGYCDNFPASFEIDHVRVYQASDHITGCSPKEKPTAVFIEGHAKRYMVSGQKQPLEDIRVGGGACATAEDCGGSERGSCHHAGFCMCLQNWTGPTCLAHAGFYDVDTSAPVPSFNLSNMIFPRSLLIVVCLLVIGFVSSMTGAIRRRAKEPKYQQVGNAMTTFSTGPGSSGDDSRAEAAAAAGNSTTPMMSASYQLSANPHYAIPQDADSNKVVTYCVIDGRLVDQQQQQQ